MIAKPSSPIVCPLCGFMLSKLYIDNTYHLFACSKTTNYNYSFRLFGFDNYNLPVKSHYLYLVDKKFLWYEHMLSFSEAKPEQVWILTDLYNEVDTLFHEGIISEPLYREKSTFNTLKSSSFDIKRFLTKDSAEQFILDYQLL